MKSDSAAAHRTSGSHKTETNWQPISGLDHRKLRLAYIAWRWLGWAPCLWLTRTDPVSGASCRIRVRLHKIQRRALNSEWILAGIVTEGRPNISHLWRTVEALEITYQEHTGASQVQPWQEWQQYGTGVRGYLADRWRSILPPGLRRELGQDD